MAIPAAPAHAPAAEPVPEPLVLYDGECGLCHHTVKWLLKRDRGQLWYAPLQGETADRLRARGMKIPTDLSTVTLVDGGRVFVRSKVFLHGAKYLTRPWRWAYAFRWMPGFLFNWLYRIIARVRYRIWGKLDSCQIPDVAVRSRFLP